MEVAKLIYPYMASIGIAYFVTLCLYPGIISEIISCKFGSWMPVILMTAFNGADLLGKVNKNTLHIPLKIDRRDKYSITDISS